MSYGIYNKRAPVTINKENSKLKEKFDHIEQFSFGQPIIGRANNTKK